MDRFKGIAKGGWHPEGVGGSSSSGERKGIRGSVKGLMGKGEDTTSRAENHQSRPLASLKDPASFAPPPKRVGTASSAGGYGAPTPPSRQGTGYMSAHAAEEAEEEPRPPPGPYRADTTGLSTAHLPKPPVRRLGQDGQSSIAPAPAPKPKPSLPPRLPPRQNSHPDLNAPPPPPTYQDSVQQPPANSGYLNQGALSRLGHAGVSVPGFNIGRKDSPPLPPRTGQTPPQISPAATGQSGRSGQLGELQSRFSRMNTGSSGTPAATSPGGGTTFAQKQSAFKTANALRTNPSSVSMRDLRSSASTANNFRERHGEQVAAGYQTANGLNQKYGVMNKVSGFAAAGGAAASPGSGSSGPSPVGKKPPPPPPKKRAQLSGDGGEGGAPPPIPLSSKPGR
ncbi:hypothetical protein K490DRAFT_50314 [Saccharata proteae CBS 121410]|uniref:Uncharacterized protein n=1 Tax=Saccharata proteae CBS 121410 TaxID=1314787 RepID=A0A9P4HQ73_9PEZI|nr:hypothetical protein K490DRAFT_50314 [Saccharata proteae CBS 121410]